MIKRLLDEAKRIIQIPSITADGNEAIANHLAVLLNERGFKTNLQQVTHSIEGFSKRQFNLIGIMGDPLVDRKIKTGLLLNTHLDTVSPGILDYWTETNKNPFNPVIKDGKVFGLGSADVKLDFLCKLFAASRFREKKLKMPIYLVGTCGEETGMFGAKYLIKSYALNPKYVLVGEPSELKLIHAHKSLNVFKVSVGFHQVERDARGFNRKVDFFSFGKSAHGSYPHLGINSIAEMILFLKRAQESGFEFKFVHFAGGEAVNKVPDRSHSQFYLTSHQFEDFKRFFKEVTSTGEFPGTFRIEMGGVGDSGINFLPDAVFSALEEVLTFFANKTVEFETLKDETYNPSFSTISLGKMDQSQGKIDLYFDVRLLPDIVLADIEAHFNEEVKEIAKKFPKLNITLTRERTNPGLNMSPESDLVTGCLAAMRSSGVEPVLAKKATSTEAAQYFLAGYDAVVIGPGLSMGNSHSPNEHNLIDQLEKAVYFYEKVIERFCL